jgi:N-methylhydantoinase A
MLTSDIRHDYVRTHAYSLEEVDFESAKQIYLEFKREGDALLAAEGVAPAQRDIRLSLDIRYIGQEYYLNVPITEEQLFRADRAGIRSRYEAIHERHYAQRGTGEAVEMVNLRVSAHGLRAKAPIRAGSTAGTGAAPGSRSVFLDDAHVPVRCAIYDRSALAPGECVRGPAIIEEDASTVLLLEGDRATICPDGEILIDIEGA